jgi:hypothetical protein
MGTLKRVWTLPKSNNLQGYGSDFSQDFSMLTLMQGIVSLTIPVLQQKQVPARFEFGEKGGFIPFEVQHNLRVKA